MLSLDTGKTNIFLQKCITTQYGEKIHAKNISVLWKHKNVRPNVNNLIKFITVPDHPATGVAFEEGYWTFNMIADHLAESGITLERHMHDNRCSILSPKKLNLYHFRPLLGLEENTIIQKIPKRNHLRLLILTAVWSTLRSDVIASTPIGISIRTETRVEYLLEFQ